MENKELQEAYGLIVNSFRDSNCEVSLLCLNDHTQKPPNIESFYVSAQKEISKVDAVVVEASIDKFELGQVATFAFISSKPVLILHKSREYQTRTESTKFIIKKYRDIQDLRIIITSFINIILACQYTKFNFIIPSEIDKYLEWISANKKRPKSEVARDAIQRVMNEDIEYKNYLLK